MNSEIIHQRLGSYQLGISRTLTPTQGAALLKLFEEAPIVTSESTLAGRGSVTHGELQGFGRIVVKRYHRGGWLGHLIKDSHIRTGRVRSQLEFERLQQVRALGVSAPQPIAYAFRGLFIYQAWLVMQEIEQHESLASLSLRDEERARNYTEELALNIIRLVEARVYHIDLHPGNVLIDAHGTLFLIDFDKARGFTGTRNDLRDLYLVRWRRAVIKHGLPEFLSEILSASVRRHFEP